MYGHLNTGLYLVKDGERIVGAVGQLPTGVVGTNDLCRQ